jgi:acetoin utilization deacetylase AcuC-like enzyme/ankyrin repeat protein
MDEPSEALVSQCREILLAYGKPVDGDDMDAEQIVQEVEDVVDIDSAEELGKRKVHCLHWAAERGYTEILQKLLEIGNNMEGVTEALEGATPLHHALLNSHAGCASVLISNSSDVNSVYERQPCLHLAIGPGRFPQTRSASLEMLKSLIQGNADVSALDAEGCTAVHRAAVSGMHEAIEMLHQAGASLSQQDYGLSSPLHYAVLCHTDDGAKCVSTLLEDYEQKDVEKRSACYGTALELAAAVGNVQAVKLILDRWPSLANKSAEALAAKQDAPVGALLLHSATCELHAPKPSYGPESAERLAVLIGSDTGVLRAPEFGSSRLRWEHVTQQACITDVLRVHEYSYIRKLQSVCAGLAPDAMVRLDTDTAVTPESYSAAFCAAAAAVRAVDAVVDGECSAAFCCTRPAGHHAGPSGPSECFFEVGKKSESHGFCLLSNAAIAAAHALAVRARDGIKKVAIVDFDVHHGNGTEECVRNLVPHQVSSNMETPMGDATFKRWSYKPWRDEKDTENVLFCSVHAHGDVAPTDGAKYSSGATYTGMFYPGTGSDVEHASKGGILNLPLGPRFGTAEFRTTVERDLLPRCVCMPYLHIHTCMMMIHALCRL